MRRQGSASPRWRQVFCAPRPDRGVADSVGEGAASRLGRLHTEDSVATAAYGILNSHVSGPIAQLARASRLHREGRGFESLWAHHADHTLDLVAHSSQSFRQSSAPRAMPVNPAVIE